MTCMTCIIFLLGKAAANDNLRKGGILVLVLSLPPYFWYLTWGPIYSTYNSEEELCVALPETLLDVWILTLTHELGTHFFYWGAMETKDS